MSSQPMRESFLFKGPITALGDTSEPLDADTASALSEERYTLVMAVAAKQAIERGGPGLEEITGMANRVTGGHLEFERRAALLSVLHGETSSRPCMDGMADAACLHDLSGVEWYGICSL